MPISWTGYNHKDPAVLRCHEGVVNRVVVRPKKTVAGCRREAKSLTKRRCAPLLGGFHTGPANVQASDIYSILY